MESLEIVVGLDIGTTKIAAIVGRRNEYGKIEVLGIGKSESIGVTRGVVANIEKTVQSIRMAVEEAAQKSGVNVRVVNVGIAGQHIKSIQHRGNIMRNTLDDEIKQRDIDILVENMYKLVMQPGEEIIHVIPQEYIVDKEPGIKDPVGMSGICLEANFHIITDQVAAAKNIHKCVGKADLEVAELILEPLASADAVLSEEEKEAGVVLVDIGGGTTDIAIYKNEIIKIRAAVPTLLNSGALRVYEKGTSGAALTVSPHSLSISNVGSGMEVKSNMFTFSTTSSAVSRGINDLGGFNNDFNILVEDRDGNDVMTFNIITKSSFGVFRVDVVE